VNRLTGRPYGPAFPRITFGDIVTTQYRLTADVFFMLADSDRLFPSKDANEVLNRLIQHAVPYRYVELKTEYGHQRHP
jgi:homoserine acetyltransferase